MGVPQFLVEALATAGRKVDLRYYAHGVRFFRNDERRPLRIGVDISSWIYKACQGFSDMLGDERHLTNYGRATLANHDNTTDSSSNDADGPSSSSSSNGQVDEQALKYITTCANYVTERLIALRDSCECTLLVVIDGSTPPIKLREVRERSAKRRQAEKQRDEPVDMEGSNEAQERRIKAFRRAGAGKFYEHVVTHVTIAMRQNQIAFLVAPYESDGQLAFLSHKGYIDLIVTEDSDLVAYGASPILYKLSESIKDGEPRGILLRAEDLAGNARKMNLLDFSPAMLTVLFVAVGSDYCKKLKGVGIVGACNIVRHAFFSKEKDPLEIVFEKLLAHTWESDLTPEAKEDYRKSFLAALLMFRHPVVFDPINACCIMVEGREEGGDPELRCHGPYAELLDNLQAREKIVGSVVASPLATYIAEGWISAKTYKPRLGVEIPGCVRRDLKRLLEPTPARTGEVREQEMETQEVEEGVVVGSSNDESDRDKGQQNDGQEVEEDVVVVDSSDDESGRDKGQQNDGQELEEEVVLVDSSNDKSDRDKGQQNDGDGTSSPDKERKRKMEGNQVETAASKRLAASDLEVIDLRDDDDDNLETQAP